MNSKKSKLLELNKLKVRKEFLYSQLKKDFEAHYDGAMHLDIMSLTNLVCEHQCGIESEFSERAFEIEEIQRSIERKLNVYFWPRWRAARLLTNSLIKSGRISTDEQFNKAAEFITEVEMILSDDLVAKNEAEEEQNKEAKENENLVLLAELMHPWILEHSFAQFRNGHLRDAVLNAFIALGDLIRERTGINLDGSALATEALSIKNPKLVLSEIDSDSGKNDQIGFMQIIQGSFTGIRNPKAHSVRHDLTEHKAAQYLILASLLARRITEASAMDTEND